MNRTTTILVERAEHVPLALERRRRDPSAALLALAPDVMTQLDARGESYVTPEDALGPEFRKTLGRTQYDLLEALGRWVDTAFPPALVDPNPIWVHYFWLKILVDSVALRVCELTAALGRTDRAVAFAAEGDDLWAPPDTYQFVLVDGPIYSTLVPDVARWLGIDHEIVATPRLTASPVPIGPSMLSGARETAARAAAALRAAPGPAAARAAVRFGGMRHDMPALSRAAERVRPLVPLDLWSTRAGRRLSGWLGARASDRRLRAQAESAWRAAEPALARQPIFHASGRDIYPIVKHAFRSIFTTGAVEGAKRFRTARRLVRRAPFALAIQSGSWDDALLAFACRAEGVPMVYAQEGGLHGYVDLPMYQHCSLSMATHFITYGPGVSAYLEGTRPTDRQRARCVAAGAMRLTAALAARSPRPDGPIRRVLYVPTDDFDHAVTYAPLRFSDREYSRQRRRVLEALLAIDGIEILYKSPADTLARDSCRDFLTAHADRIEPDFGTIVNACHRADLVVLDWPTTVLLEVLTSGRPVAALFAEAVMDPVPEAMDLLRRRAWVSVTVEEFIAHIRCAVRGAAGPDPDDQTFLDAYGTGGEGAWGPGEAASFFEGLCPAT